MSSCARTCGRSTTVSRVRRTEERKKTVNAPGTTVHARARCQRRVRSKRTDGLERIMYRVSRTAVASVKSWWDSVPPATRTRIVPCTCVRVKKVCTCACVRLRHCLCAAVCASKRPCVRACVRTRVIRKERSRGMGARVWYTRWRPTDVVTVPVTCCLASCSCRRRRRRESARATSVADLPAVTPVSRGLAVYRGIRPPTTPVIPFQITAAAAARKFDSAKRSDPLPTRCRLVSTFSGTVVVAVTGMPVSVGPRAR